MGAHADEAEIALDLRVRSRSTGSYAIPRLPMPEDEHEIGHNDMIYRLAVLGKAARYSVWIGKNEQTESYRRTEFKNLSLTTFPIQKSRLSDKQYRRIIQIDVIWFDGMGRPQFAFEVENTPVIIPALDRFKFLLDLDSDVAGKLVIVAPSWARSKVHDELMHSTYVGAPLYMENKVKYVYYPALVMAYESAASAESPDIVKEILAILRDPRLLD